MEAERGKGNSFRSNLRHGTTFGALDPQEVVNAVKDGVNTAWAR
jgi:hypothetical protein